MPSYEHSELLRRLTEIDSRPEHPEARAIWHSGEPQRALLKKVATESEVIIYAAGDSTFIHSVLVPNSALSPIDKDDLLQWNGNPYHTASYCYGGNRQDVWIENGGQWLGAKTLTTAQQFIYARHFHDYAGELARYEPLQEFLHVEGLFHLEEERSYCRLDNVGDLDHVISYTVGEHAFEMSLFSCKWDNLQRYMAVTDQSLLLMFDFTRVHRGNFPGWGGQHEKLNKRAKRFFYREASASDEASYTRGVQLIPVRKQPASIFDEYKQWPSEKRKSHAGFVAYDWRNRRITQISTDPRASTNYFEAKKNSKPYELSPAFFRPEVLSKYRSDKDKYRFRERDLICRNSWVLRSFDVNDAGQVHAYIVYLRDLPYSEQLHWQSFNEPPRGIEKGPIPFITKRAFQNHFLGQWTDDIDPIDNIKAKLRSWGERGYLWWRLPDPELVDHVLVPLTDSVDEWAESFLELAKLVVEGFAVRPLRAVASEMKIEFTKAERTVSLLERILRSADVIEPEERLEGLREVQLLRSKGKPHAARESSRSLAKEAKKNHGSYRQHFHEVCRLVLYDLTRIEGVLSASADA